MTESIKPRRTHVLRTQRPNTASPSGKQPRGAAPSHTSDEPLESDYDYYGGWFGNIVERLDEEVRKIRSIKNIELGEEFEIALCRALRPLLPDRVGVCRGWIVDVPGAVAGDDIIVYDAARFPTLRALGRAAEAKEHVPAEAVLAYIEAKYTLYAQTRVPTKSSGQSLTKACKQIAAIKALHRTPVPLEAFAPRFLAPKGTFAQRLGFPPIRNPWYAAIWALNLVVDAPLKQSPATALSARIADIERRGTPRLVLPDVIAAGSVCMMPMVHDQQSDHHLARPMITDVTQLSFTQGVKALAVAVLHLTWAIEDIMLGEIRWVDMMHNHLAFAERRHGESVILPTVRDSVTVLDKASRPSGAVASSSESKTEDGRG